MEIREWVVMRLDFSSCLTSEGSTNLYQDFEVGQEAAINFGGICVPLKEAIRIMTKMEDKK